LWNNYVEGEQNGSSIEIAIEADLQSLVQDNHHFKGRDICSNIVVHIVLVGIDYSIVANYRIDQSILHLKAVHFPASLMLL
jgi:hypothetical protein